MSSSGANRYLEGRNAPVSDEITAFDLPVTGELPAQLSGRWLRNGPNPIAPPEPRNYHWFTGDGMVHGVRIRDGAAEWYRNRWLRSDRVAEALGEPPVDGPQFAASDFGPNTSVGGFAGKTWAMVEAGWTPMTLDYELDTIARDDFDGTLTGPFSAHPKYDPRTGELHAMGYAYPALAGHLHYVVVGPDGRVTRTTEIPVDGMPMVHDMSLTERYAIVYDLSVTVDFERAMAGGFPFGWNPGHGARIGLLPRDGNVDGLIWCEVPPCALFHPLNAYDDADGSVVVDLCRYDSLFETDLQGPFGDATPTLERWTVNPISAAVAIDEVDGRGHEFPVVNGANATRRHRYGYTAAVTNETDGIFGPTYKVDFSTGRVTAHDHGTGRGGAEPLFVARDGATEEDDGWLMVLVHEDDGADLVLLDARDLSASPVATITLPRRVPHGFHGAWIPDASVGPD